MPRLITVVINEKNDMKPVKVLSQAKYGRPNLPQHSSLGIITTPTKNDIISGRGTHVYNHHGNINFMSLVKKYQSKHEVCPKSLKKVHSKEIYLNIRKLNPPGRFLKTYTNGNGRVGWVEMDYKNTILKIRQAMRDNELREMRIRQTLKNYAVREEDSKRVEESEQRQGTAIATN